MKKALLKDSLKEVKNTYKRFISILLMAFLGVGFFAGIRATSPDMVNTIDKYFDEQNVYDIKVLSTLGLVNDDIDAISKIEGVENVYGEYSEDILIKFEDTEIVSKVLSIDEVNKISLVNGSMPKNSNECLVEESFCKSTNKNIGDTIVIEKEENSIIKEDQVVIVGTMNSSLYISKERDTSKLGSGRVGYNMYLPKESFNSEIYTEVYITLEDAKKLNTNSNKYKEYVKEVQDKIEQIKEERQNARYNEVIGKAQKELNDAKEKFDKEKQDAEDKIQNAENEILKAEKSIKESQTELNKNTKQVQEKFNTAEKEIEYAKEQIVNKENNIHYIEQETSKVIEQYEQQSEELKEKLEILQIDINKCQEEYNEVIGKLENNNLTDEQVNMLEIQKLQLESTLTDLEIQKNNINESINTIEKEIKTAKQKIEDAKKQITDGKLKIENQEETLIQNKEKTNKELQNAQTQINSSKEKIISGKKELEENKLDFQEKIKNAERELSEAQEKLEEIKSPTWYIIDRYSNTAYNSYMQDTKSIENIGKVFPVVFFVIATLISLNSMTRMVEEQRVQIGTLKALGYNKIQIARKYLLYAGIACFTGGILGMLVGFNMLPKIIFLMYSMMYNLPDFVVSFNWHYAIVGQGIAIICIVGATLYSTLEVLSQTPSNLMRPKAPNPGKRVILERIPFIWKHLNFNNKVTVRNIFRYKKRFLMTIIGIAGCTALILTGFGIRDAISSILPSQYEKIYSFDMQIAIKASIEEEKISEIIQELKQKQGIEKVVETYMSSLTLVNNNKEEDVQIIVPKDNNFEEIINLIDIKTKEHVELNENEIIITDKVAQLLNVEVGDTIIIKDVDNIESEIKVSNIVENYVYHYVYMSQDLYEKLYDSYKTNVIFVQNNLNEEEEKELSQQILKEPEINTINLNATAKSSLDETMKSLNYVVIILIVSAGLLAFVILYNLSNVNISERIRELATIKVLGFYNKEVYDYISRETIILTIIGIIFGLIGGYFLNYFIMGTCEINILRFPKEIKFISYIYAILITIVFTIIVNIVTYFSLKKIDMIESLKSIE